MIVQRIQDRFHNLLSDIQTSHSLRRQTIIICIALLVCIAAGISGLFFLSNLTPIFVGLGLFALLLLAAGLKRPWYVLFAALFIIFVPDGFMPVDIQSYLNRGMTLFTFAVWVFDLLINNKKVHLPIPSMMMVGFLAWSILSMTWAQDFAVSLELVQRYVLRFLLFLLLTVNLIDTREKLNGLMNILMVIGFAIVFAGIVQFLMSGYTPGSRFSILGMNENAVGVLLLVALLGVLWWASQPSQKYGRLKRLIGVLYVLAAILLIAMTGSRGSAISLVATLCLLLLWKSTRFWGNIALIIVVLALVLAPFLFLTTFDRFMLTGDTGGISIGGREGLWQAAWLMIRDHPVLGVGIGNAYLNLKHYLSDVSIPTYVLPVQVWSAESSSPHNPVLTIWADIGTIGLLLYLGILISAVYLFLKSYLRNRGGSMQMYYGLLIAIFCGYILSWFKGGGMESDHSFFLMIALLIIPSTFDKMHDTEGTDIIKANGSA